eukprot:scaffold15032_cov119-Cylindrotheca_fusiformis.AAC.2
MRDGFALYSMLSTTNYEPHTAGVQGKSVAGLAVPARDMFAKMNDGLSTLSTQLPATLKNIVALNYPFPFILIDTIFEEHMRTESALSRNDPSDYSECAVVSNLGRGGHHNFFKAPSRVQLHLMYPSSAAQTKLIQHWLVPVNENVAIHICPWSIQTHPIKGGFELVVSKRNKNLHHRRSIC